MSLNLVLSWQMDPQICRVIHYGIQRGMGMTAVTLAALLTSGMRMFFHKKGADQRAQDLVNRKRAELMDPQVVTNTIVQPFSYVVHYLTG